MSYRSKQQLIQKSTRIILGVFLFVFSILGACLFSPVSSQAAMNVDSYDSSHVNMESPDQALALMHPDGDYFALDTPSGFFFSLLLLSTTVFFVFCRITLAPFLKKKWHQFQRWVEVHHIHSPYLSLLQDGIVHPKIF